MYSALPAFVACYFLFVGVLVLQQNGKDSLARIFFAICLTTFGWQASWSLLFKFKSEHDALVLAKLGWAFILFLPTTLYHFLSILSNKRGELRAVYCSYAFSFLLLISLLFTDSLISGLYPYYWGYYPKAGLLHPLHVLQTTIVVLRGLYITYRAQCSAADHRIKSQLSYCIIAILVYLFASVDYLCNYGIEFYPPGIIFITIGLTLISYTIVRYHLLDVPTAISIAITRFVIYSIFSVLFIAGHLLVTGKPFPERLTVLFSEIAFIIFCCECYSYAKEKVQSLSHGFLVKERKKQLEGIRILTKNLSNQLSIRHLKAFLEDYFSNNLESKVLGFYLKEDQLFPERHGEANGSTISSSYVLVNTADPFDQIEEENSSFTKVGIDKEFLARIISHRSYVKIDEDILADKSKNASLVPFLINENLVGFIIASSKHGHFSNWHYEVFNILTTQLAIILDRIFAYKKLSYQKEKFHREQIKNKELLARAIAHEMRNPLSAVSLNIDDAFSTIFANKKEDGSVVLSEVEAIEITKKERLLVKVTNRAHEKINRILAESRGQKIEVRQEFLSAKQELEEAITEYGFQEKAHRDKVILNVKDDFIFKGNETQFLQVIENLIKNALDLLKEKPDLTVTISTEITESSNIIHVQDTGPGMPEEVRAKLYQGEKVTSGKEGGTGIGSNVCKQIMTEFGGNIICTSEVGKGTRIDLLFTKLTPEELEEVGKVRTNYEKNSSNPTTDFSSYSLIIIDDNKAVLKGAVGFVQRKLKCRVDSASTIEEAISLLSQNKYDFILLDIVFDDNPRAGIEIAHQIKNNPNIANKNKDAPLICVSGDKDEEALKEGEFDDYLGKIMPSTLMPMIEKWVKNK